jgi:hypothetical protein
MRRLAPESERVTSTAGFVSVRASPALPVTTACSGSAVCGGGGVCCVSVQQAAACWAGPRGGRGTPGTHTRATHQQRLPHTCAREPLDAHQLPAAAAASRALKHAHALHADGVCPGQLHAANGHLPRQHAAGCCRHGCSARPRRQQVGQGSEQQRRRRSCAHSGCEPGSEAGSHCCRCSHRAPALPRLAAPSAAAVLGARERQPAAAAARAWHEWQLPAQPHRQAGPVVAAMPAAGTAAAAAVGAGIAARARRCRKGHAPRPAGVRMRCSCCPAPRRERQRLH